VLLAALLVLSSARLVVIARVMLPWHPAVRALGLLVLVHAVLRGITLERELLGALLVAPGRETQTVRRIWVSQSPALSSRIEGILPSDVVRCAVHLLPPHVPIRKGL
jgi:hypothetical protein